MITDSDGYGPFPDCSTCGSDRMALSSIVSGPHYVPGEAVRWLKYRTFRCHSCGSPHIQTLEEMNTAPETVAPETAPHQPGAKLDAGKPRMGLVLNGFCHALLAVGRVGTWGAAKYTDDGFLKVPDGVKRYTDAMYRHLLAEASGEADDPESELSHAAHTAWNALARLELMLREAESRIDTEILEHE
jgi:hypothetical protein